MQTSLATADTNLKTWDIFCRVVDNYGDIGVCWRLARQLADEHQLSVRLWVDEIAALKQIWPETKLTSTQMLAKVQVCIWQEDFHTEQVAEVVIEAFACHLPENYIAQMKQAAKAPCWINLEYLSAESWVEGCHQLTSMHPQNGLKKTFFFPGFNQQTGGLLRESNLLAQRDKLLLKEARSVFLTQLGVSENLDNALIISLFSYENQAIASLITTWSQALNPIICLVPASKALASVNAALNLNFVSGGHHTIGSLQLKVIPFLNQMDYDRLLWACDINFVRGEDSFVRAQWAARPFVWHIYPQDEAAHLIKLNAFLDKYTHTMEPALAAAINQLWNCWNWGENCSDPWNQLMEQLQNWRQYNQHWHKHLSAMPDLATNLVCFAQKKPVEIR
ncbi:MAG: elongation factor P maturation arginine rhamnosyltransferase EarP [Pseudomonadota bacterium]